MSNGPLGGFMPTPPAPSQPPQVKVDTTADSRGNFNNFLKNMNSAAMFTPPIAPLGLGSGMPSAIQPTINPMNDIDIFNQPVQMMFNGGAAGDYSDFAGFDDPSDPFGGGSDDFSKDEEVIGTPVDISQEVAALPDVFTGTDTSMFSDDPAFVDRRGVNVGLETRGGFTEGVVPGLRGERFARFENVPFALRGIGRDFTTKLRNAGGDGLTVQDYFNIYNPEGTNKDRIAEFTKLTGKGAGDELGMGDLPNIMNIQGKYEAGLRNIPSNFVQAAVKTVPMNDSKEIAKTFEDFGISNQKILDLGKGADQINKEIPVPFGKIGADTTISPDGTITRKITSTPSYYLDQMMDIEKAVGESGATSNITPSIFDSSNITEGALGARNRGTSQDTIETAKNAIRASAGNNMAIDNLVAQFGSLDPSIAELAGRTKRGVGEIGEIRPGDVEDLSGTPTSLLSTLDPLNIVSTQGVLPTKSPVPAAIANVPEIDSSGIPYREDRIFGTLPFRPDADAFDDGAMRGETIQQVVNRLNRPLGEVTTGVTEDRSPGRIQAEFGPRVASLASGLGDQRVSDIGNLVNKPSVFENIGFPSVVKSVLSGPERFSRNRMANQLAIGRTSPFVGQRQNITDDMIIRDRDGNVTGITDKFGNILEGMDYRQQDDFGKDEEIRRIKPLAQVTTKEEEKEDVPPNIIGGGDPLPVPEIVPTVVASPFAPSSAKISPVNFDTGDLNKLIEMLTGVAAKPIVSAKKGGVIGMANGGLIKAVDDFLAAG